MISIDTEIMRQLVSACSAANDSINEAVDVLNRVTAHNDWGCKERNSINEYTNQNKVRIRALQEKSKSFLSTLTQVSHDFENAETSISDMFSSLESLLGGVIAIPITGGGLINTGTWGGNAPQIPSNFQNIFNDFFGNSITPIKPTDSGYRPGIDVSHGNDGEITGPGYNPITGEGVFHYDEDGNLLYATMSAPLEKYEANNITAIPTVCNFEDLSFGGGE